MEKGTGNGWVLTQACRFPLCPYCQGKKASRRGDAWESKTPVLWLRLPQTASLQGLPLEEDPWTARRSRLGLVC